MEYKFGIITYRRYDRQFTARYLLSIGVNPSNIVFAVQNLTERDELLKRGYDIPIVCREGRNAADNRNTLLDQYPKGMRIVLLDDDIKFIGKLRIGAKNELQKIDTADELLNWIKKGFDEADKIGTPLWGIYPTPNPFFMKLHKRRVALCEGTFMGITIVDERFNPDYALKQDYEYSCRIIKRFGRLLRYDFLAAQSLHRKQKGGCSEWYEEDPRYFKMIMRDHGDILRPNPRRKNEILLRNEYEK